MRSHSDLDSFSAASLKLYDPALDAGSYAVQVTAFLGELVGADMICVAAMDKKQGSLSVHFSGWDSALPSLLEGFGRTMTKYPLFNWDPAVNAGRPFFRRNFFSERQFRDLDIYSESFGLMGWNNHCAVHVPTTDDHVVFVGLERSGTVDYSERDRKMLELAQAHLSNALRLAHARTSARQEHPVEARELVEAGFSLREADVLRWLTEGKSNPEIAKLLGVTVQTVKFHLTGIFNKIGAGNRLAATLHAFDVARRNRRTGPGREIAVRVK